MIAVAELWLLRAAHAQSLSATTLLNSSNATLSIVNASTYGMPIRLSTGPLGQIKAMEIDSQGGTWVRGPLSIGADVGALASERLRIGSVVPNGGTGIVVSMAGTQQSTAMSIRDIGQNGSEHAGIALSSQNNGTGTGIRIGGANTTGRPTLQTAIDITGGLGIRYNALNAGTATAIEIGGTTPPRRGIDISVSGTDHVGVISRANSNGTGVLGISQSSTADAPTQRLRTGVMGYAASNSASGTDTLIGAHGLSVRAGNGGSQTVTIGIHGRAIGRSTQHSGTTIGVMADASTSASGTYASMAGCFLGDSNSFALVALGGDVILGGRRETLPELISSSAIAQHSTQTTVYMHDATVSGTLRLRQHCVPLSDVQVLPVQNGLVLTLTATGVQRVAVTANKNQIGGLDNNAEDGSIIYLLPMDGPLVLLHNEPTVLAEQRFLLPNQQQYTLEPDMVHTLWYDAPYQRWRIQR
jgi:hypothetical protein